MLHSAPPVANRDDLRPADERELAPLRRLALVGAAWLGLWLATPGFLQPDGFLSLAVLSLVPWAYAASRPGRRAFLVEWLAAAVGLSAQTFWTVNVLWITLLAVAIVPALYMACAGLVLRRLARVLPLSLAAPAAWIGLETLSGIVEPPFGFLWMRFGHHAHDHALLLGALRVVGVGGVGFALAALSGLVADAWRARAERRPLGRAPVVAASVPALVVVGASLFTAPPATVAGPRVLLVQPAFEAKRKQRPPSAEVLFEETVALTRAGLARAAERGEPVDLVVWGETVFPWPIAEPSLGAAYARGARVAPWGQHAIGPAEIERLHGFEEDGIARFLFGKGRAQRVIPPGTLFATGAEEYIEREGLIRRSNGIVVFGEGGTRLGRGGKIHLVPGGESLAGLERIAWVRNTAYDLAGYLPDLVADDRTAVVELPLRDGRRVRVGLTVCFDNTYDGPYTEPTRRGPLDFHLITSNEAWYVESWEFDQMIAFSRCVAAATGRSMVRATNSGISVVIGPDGRDVERLRGPGGKDRNVSGSLLATVPIPREPAGPTPYARVEPVLRGGWVVLPIALWLLVRRRDGYRGREAR
ncbi:MAG: apolipoprotein N-acyltransferase [Planctomycetes bacterium]|nr:apolipoprotein N-acyltransferase [Planctomycetota bacterium]